MSNYLTRLLVRAWQPEATLPPRVASRFELPAVDSWGDEQPSEVRTTLVDGSPAAPRPAKMASRGTQVLAPLSPERAQPAATPSDSSHEAHRPTSAQRAPTIAPTTAPSRVPLVPSEPSPQRPAAAVSEPAAKTLAVPAPRTPLDREEQGAPRRAGEPTPSLSQPRSDAAAPMPSPPRRAWPVESERVLTIAPPALPRKAGESTQPKPLSAEPRAPSLPSDPRTAPHTLLPAPSALLLSDDPAQPLLPRAERPSPRGQSQEPVLRVTIGRVEVRATTPARQTPTAPRPRPALSLDDYLTGRNGGRR